MTGKASQRRLTAIVSADVAGYSRLMSHDEEGTLAALNAHRRELIDPKIEAFGGRIVKTTGDGLLIEFPSVVNATRCALQVQTGMQDRNVSVPANRRIEFRIGINVGDIISEDGDIFGDGVNIAARLQEAAQPGEILVSRAACEQVRNKLDVSISDMGERRFKNIAVPVHTYRLTIQGDLETKNRQTKSDAHAGDQRRKPAIAVLAFDNLSSEPKLASMADGLADDIRTALSKGRFAHVLVSNSALSRKSTKAERHEIPQRVEAEYALKGSIRTVGNGVRLTSQLIDARTGSQLWADRYDWSRDDLETPQPELTAKMVAAIEWALLEAARKQIEPSEGDGTVSSNKTRRAVSHLYRFTQKDSDTAIRLLEEEVAKDPDAFKRQQVLATAYCVSMLFAWAADPAKVAERAFHAADKAVQLQPRDPYNQSVLGWSSLYIKHYQRALSATRRITELYPNAAVSWGSLAFALAFAGKGNEALLASRRYSEFDADAPLYFAWLLGPALAHHSLGQFRECIEVADVMARRQPNCFAPFVLMASSYGHLAASTEARDALSEVHRLHPEPVLSWLRPFLPLQIDAHYEKIVAGLIAASV